MTPREVAEAAVRQLERGRTVHPGYEAKELIVETKQVEEWRAALKRYDERANMYYASKNSEEYCESLDNYIENGFWDLDELVEVHVYRRKAIQVGWLRRMAERLAECWAENFIEEYGNPEGDFGAGDGAREQDLIRTLLMWSERAEVWQCEPTGEVRILEEGYEELPA